MKRLVSFLIILVIFILPSCSSNLGGRMDNTQKNELDSEGLVNNILEILYNNDREGLINLFSSKARTETNNLEECADTLLRYFDAEGSPQDWTLSKIGTQNSTSMNSGKMTSKNIFRYNIITAEKTYYISLIYYDIDMFDENNIGVYRLLLAEEDESHKYISKWSKSDLPGIYVPEID